MASTINISLPEPMQRFVEDQVEAGDFGGPEQYIRELIVRDQDRQQRYIEQLFHVSPEDEANAVEIPADVLDRGDIVEFLEAHLNSRES